MAFSILDENMATSLEYILNIFLGVNFVNLQQRIIFSSAIAVDYIFINCFIWLYNKTVKTDLIINEKI